jgi:putative acetyltransferase
VPIQGERLAQQSLGFIEPSLVVELAPEVSEAHRDFAMISVGAGVSAATIRQLVALCKYFVAEYTLMTETTPAPLVADLREASRRVVRQLGLLSRTVPSTRQSVSQCHLLIELERRRCASVAELAEAVCLDKSTTSRALSGLERAGLVEPVADPEDRRRKPLRLTRRGKTTVAGIHQRSDAQVQSALACLAAEDSLRVLEGMSLYAKALERSRRLDGVTVRPIRPRDNPRIARLISQVLVEYGAGGPGFQYDDPAVDRLYEAAAEAKGEYFVASRRGEILGGAGFGPLAGGAATDCELQKMYLAPEARGLGLGARLLRHCLERAGRRGFRRCYLETMAHMLEARSLYERHGFVRVENPMGATGHCWCNTFYARAL